MIELERPELFRLGVFNKLGVRPVSRPVAGDRPRFIGDGDGEYDMPFLRFQYQCITSLSIFCLLLGSSWWDFISLGLNSRNLILKQVEPIY